MKRHSSIGSDDTADRAAGFAALDGEVVQGKVLQERTRGRKRNRLRWLGAGSG